MRTRQVVAMAFLVGAALASGKARAQPAAGAVAAEALFNEGRELLAQGRLAEACRKLESSQKIDPAVGTLFSMGECYEGQARLASAWFAYRAAAALAGSREDRRRVAAQKKADTLEPGLAHLVLRLRPGSAPRDITLDGDRIVPDAVGSPIPVDPGRHHVEARGGIPWTRDVDVPDNGATVPVEIPPAADLAGPNETLHVPVARRVLGVGLAAGGAAVLATASVLGMQAIVKGRDANHACTTGLACGDASAVHENGVAKTDADASSVLFPLGIVLGAAGAYLLATSRATLEPVVSPTAARLDVRWSW